MFGCVSMMLQSCILRRDWRLYYDSPPPNPDPNPKTPTTMQCSVTAFHLIKCTSRTSCPPMSSYELELHKTNTGSWHRWYRLDGWTFKLMSVEAQHGCMPCGSCESWMMSALFWGPVGGDILTWPGTFASKGKLVLGPHIQIEGHVVLPQLLERYEINKSDFC